MTEKFIARAIKGQEFIFDKRIMIAVPKTSATRIADALTKMRYKLKDGEVWHVYDNDWYYNDFITGEIKRYGNRMNVYNYYG